MAKRAIVSVIALATLAGCAQQKVWEKAGASTNDFSQERYACLQQSQQPYSGAYVSRYGGSASSGMSTNGGLFDACMNSHGWNLTAKTESGATPYTDAMNALNAEGHALCEREDLQAYYRKTACLAPDVSLDQLANKSKITADEKVAITKLRSEVGALSRKFQDAHRRLNPQTGAEIALSLERGNSAADKNALDLYEGRITWGEYNRRRRDTAEQFKAEAQKIARGN